MLAAFHAGFFPAAIGSLRALAAVLAVYVSPGGAGNWSGDDWANAAPLHALNSMIAKAAAFGGEVWLRADAGPYSQTGSLTLTNGGTAEQPVAIRGVTIGGAPMAAEIVGARAEPWTAGASSGSQCFRLAHGGLAFSDLRFRRIGYGCFVIAAPISGIMIDRVRATNVQCLFDTGATVTGLSIRDFEAHGFSKSAIRIRRSSSNIVIQRGLLDSEFQDGDNFANGIAFLENANGALVEDVEVRNVRSTPSRYWNGDGFATERENRDILFRRCSGVGITDAAFDLKSRSTVLEDCHGSDCKFILRLWGEITLRRFRGLHFSKPPLAGGLGGSGGSGGSGMIQLLEGAAVDVYDSVFEQAVVQGLVRIAKDGFIAIDQLTRDQWIRPAGANLFYLENGAIGECVLLDPADTVAPQITAPASASMNEGDTPTIQLTLSKPGRVEIAPGDDASQFGVYGRAVRVARQNFEAPRHPDNVVRAPLRVRGPGGVRSAPTLLPISVLDVADNPIGVGEAFAYPGALGAWWQVNDRETLFTGDGTSMLASAGDLVSTVWDKSGSGGHAVQPDERLQARLESDGQGGFYLRVDGGEWYDVGGPGAWRFPQVTTWHVYDRDDDDEGRGYLHCFPRSSTAGTSFNATWALGVLGTTSIWARQAANNWTSAGSGAPRNRPIVSSLRTADASVRTDGVAYSMRSGDVIMPPVDPITYPSSVATRRARLFADGNPTPGGFFSGRWFGGVTQNRNAPDDIVNRVRVELGSWAGISD
jgi:hypothetical protein